MSTASRTEQLLIGSIHVSSCPLFTQGLAIQTLPSSCTHSPMRVDDDRVGPMLLVKWSVEVYIHRHGHAYKHVQMGASSVHQFSHEHAVYIIHTY